MTAVARRALVVGAARGIGRATAERLAADGHRVTATWNRTAPADPGDLDWVRMDITDPASVVGGFQAARDTGQPYEVVVANAAVLRDRMAERMSDQDFRDVVDVDLMGTFRVVREAATDMRRARWGRVVLVSSVAGQLGNGGQSNYAAAKAGLLGLARTLAHELARRQVTVNVVMPGAIGTELTAALPEPLQRKFVRAVPAGRLGTPDEVAAAIGFLASERAGYVTGTNLIVDGALLA